MKGGERLCNARTGAAFVPGRHGDCSTLGEVTRRQPGWAECAHSLTTCGIDTMPKRPRSTPHQQQGRWGYILAWLVGIPVPVLVLVYLLRGCT